MFPKWHLLPRWHLHGLDRLLSNRARGPPPVLAFAPRACLVPRARLPLARPALCAPLRAGPSSRCPAAPRPSPPALAGARWPGLFITCPLAQAWPVCCARLRRCRCPCARLPRARAVRRARPLRRIRDPVLCDAVFFFSTSWASGQLDTPLRSFSLSPTKPGDQTRTRARASPALRASATPFAPYSPSAVIPGQSPRNLVVESGPKASRA